MMGNFDRKYRPQVTNQLMKRYSISHEQAEGIWQDAWVVMFTKLRNGELQAIPSNMEGYLWRICDIKVHEYYRKKARSYDYDSIDEVDDYHWERLNNDVSDWATWTAEDQRIELHKCALLDFALSQLSDKQRRLVCGFYYDHKSMKELADELGFKDETVAKSTKLRAINIMKEVVRNHDLCSFAA